MKYLYKYPQTAYPYDDLVKTNQARMREEMEYELLDNGVFADDRYYDVCVEYAKADPEELLIVVSVANRTLPGAKLFHEGQLQGLRVRLQVQLARRPFELPDPVLEGFYRTLLAAIDTPTIREGEWRVRGSSST